MTTTTRPVTMYMFSAETRWLYPSLRCGFTVASRWDSARLRRAYRDLRRAGIDANDTRDLLLNVLSVGKWATFEDAVA